MSDYWNFLNPRRGLINFGQQLWNNPRFMTNLPILGNFYSSGQEAKRQDDIIKNANGRAPAYPELFYKNNSAQGAMDVAFGGAIGGAMQSGAQMARDIIDMYPAEVMENVDYRVQSSNFRRGYNMEHYVKPRYVHPKFRLR